MASPKRYFHDHLVLLLLSVNAFIAIAGSIYTLVRLSTSHGTGYIVQYRSNLGINAFKTGGVLELLSFIAFSLLVLVFHAMFSLRVYKINRHFTLAVLGMGVLLLSLSFIISNALIVLR